MDLLKSISGIYDFVCLLISWAIDDNRHVISDIQEKGIAHSQACEPYIYMMSVNPSVEEWRNEFQQRLKRHKMQIIISSDIKIRYS